MIIKLVQCLDKTKDNLRYFYKLKEKENYSVK